MSLKYEVASLEGLDEAVAKLYEKQGDKYRLKVEGIEDTAGLKAKVAELLEESKAAKKAKKDAEDAAKAAADEAARKSGDTAALEKSWQDKLTKREKELLDEQNKRDGWLRDLTVNATASSIASELAVQGSAKALLPHIERRLTMDIRDGKPVAVVLGTDGKPSALSVDELKKEIAGDAAFAPLIVASKASGGGASGGNGGGAAKKQVTRAQFEQMAPQERMSFSKEGGSVIDQ